MKYLRTITTTFRLGFALLGLASFIWVPFQAQSEERHKVLDFEDSLVEGVNKQPLDSFSQISEKEKRKRKPHLYNKRHGFRSETEVTLREMRLNP